MTSPTTPAAAQPGEAAAPDYAKRATVYTATAMTVLALQYIWFLGFDLLSAWVPDDPDGVAAQPSVTIAAQLATGALLAALFITFAALMLRSVWLLATKRGRAWVGKESDLDERDRTHLARSAAVGCQWADLTVVTVAFVQRYLFDDVRVSLLTLSIGLVSLLARRLHLRHLRRHH